MTSPSRLISNKRNFALLTGSLLLLMSAGVQAESPRILPEGQLPEDQRLGELKNLRDYFPMEVPETKEEWGKRAQRLRRRVQVATGLFPMPKRTPLNAVIHGRVEREGFTVEKVYFESVPNHYVTGLLFRPTGKDDARPAVLCPHGHGGRLQDYGEQAIRKLIVSGAERFESSGRYPKLARCAQLARMGCVTFIFDMIGYADSVQLTREFAHKFAEQRPEFEGKDSWGLFSAQAELRLQSIMGLQTWNSIRALDFLCGLPDVDPERVGVTGGSGGGTQTILLGAIDPRPVVSFPQGMVSTSMQGGCTCENCSLLRVGTGNVELAALFAPKPQGMTAAKDWTVEMMTKGFPELQQVYKLMGAEENVMCKSLVHFPHNYNYVTRALMYSWFNQHLKLGLEEPIVEEDWAPLTPSEYTVWNEQHPKPQTGPDYERELTRYLAETSDRQIVALTPHDEASLEEYRQVVGKAFETILGRSALEPGAAQRRKVDRVDHGEYIEFTDLVDVPAYGEQLPVLSLYPTGNEWNKRVVIWIDGRGKDGLYDDSGLPIDSVRGLLESGASVVTADLVYQGEFLEDGQPLKQARVVDNTTREFAGYTLGYNHSLFAQRVHDIQTLVSYIRHNEYTPRQVDLVGVHGAGPWAAAARALIGSDVDQLFIDTRAFRFADVTSYRDINFLPGAVKYGDLPALLALSAPHRVTMAGEDGKIPALVRSAYRAADREMHVKSTKGELEFE